MTCSTLRIVAGACTAFAAVNVHADIPPHPSAIEFPALEFRVPDPAAYRRELPAGVTAYVAPSSELPLVTVSFRFRGGADLEGEAHAGAGAALAEMLRRGGTKALSPQDLDDQLDELAANVTIAVGNESSVATLDCLAQNFDAAFDLFLEMLARPGFDTDRLRQLRARALEDIEQRNDAPVSVLSYQVGAILYGTDHPAGWFPTESSVAAIDVPALQALHERIFHRGNLVVTAAGDFREAAMLSRLARALEAWPAGDPAPDPPAPAHVCTPGVYHAGTTQTNLPQGIVAIARPCIRRDDPDAIALEVANLILGGSPTSRITRRVRGEAELAYAAMSRLQPNAWYPGPFLAFAQSKNETVAAAATLMLEEIARLGAEPVTDDELAAAKRSMIDAFPKQFASRLRMLAQFAVDDMTNRPRDDWTTYRSRVDAVTAEDVQRVAREHLDPDAMAILVIGNWDAIAAGDGATTMADVRAGEVIHLPLR